MRLGLVVIFLCFTSTLRAQCDTLNKRLFDNLLVCDSVTVAQSNMIIRIQGEVEARDATINVLRESMKLERDIADRTNEGLMNLAEEARAEVRWRDRFYIGLIFILTILLFTIR